MIEPVSRGARSAPSHEERYRVVVIGGGLVGTALGLALARAGIPTAIIDADDGTDRDPGPYAQRPIALSQGSRRILDALGVWQSIGDAVEPIARIHVSDRGHFGFARLRAEDHGVDALGYVIPAAELGGALDEAARAHGPLCVLRPAVATGLSCNGATAARVALAATGTREVPTGVAADLVVLSDGGRSALREQLGIGVHQSEYGQWAVTARVETRRPHAGIAYERFTADGPLALLPLPSTHGRHCGLVWSMDAEKSAHVAALDDERFVAALEEQFGTRLGGFVSAGPRGAFPLRLVTATSVVAERVAIIGNAAHHLHPVAGQGLNLGLRDAATLAEVVADCIRQGGDPGDTAVLKRYAAWRRRDQRLVSRATDGLVRLFSNRFAPLVVARDLGLLAFDLLPPAKRRFGEHAMGLAGRQSRLARGLGP